HHHTVRETASTYQGQRRYQRPFGSSWPEIRPEGTERFTGSSTTSTSSGSSAAASGSTTFTPAPSVFRLRDEDGRASV
ncbi:hypothetical protein A2U01_0086400, partial [Trifolium medium]|nr:hypothetical protein [Trifolium medium]